MSFASTKTLYDCLGVLEVRLTVPRTLWMHHGGGSQTRLGRSALTSLWVAGPREHVRCQVFPL